MCCFKRRTIAAKASSEVSAATSPFDTSAGRQVDHPQLPTTVFRLRDLGFKLPALAVIVIAIKEATDQLGRVGHVIEPDELLGQVELVVRAGAGVFQRHQRLKALDEVVTQESANKQRLGDGRVDAHDLAQRSQRSQNRIGHQSLVFIDVAVRFVVLERKLGRALGDRNSQPGRQRTQDLSSVAGQRSDGDSAAMTSDRRGGSH